VFSKGFLRKIIWALRAVRDDPYSAVEPRLHSINWKVKWNDKTLYATAGLSAIFNLVSDSIISLNQQAW